MDRQKIAKALYDAGYTPSQIADMFGVSPATVRRWLRGAPTPTASKLEQTIQRLEVLTSKLEALISRFEGLTKFEASTLKPHTNATNGHTENPLSVVSSDNKGLESNLWVKALRSKTRA